MAYNINISNGKGNANILNGTYSATSNIPGYDNSELNPAELTVVDGTNSYDFTIKATGTLTLHVSEEGTSEGTAVVGATFKRTDSLGTEYGNIITTDSSGNAVFENVPYLESEAPIIYFKQIASDGNHEFLKTVQQTTLTESTGTVEIQNALPTNRTINLTDEIYGLPLNGEISLN